MPVVKKGKGWAAYPGGPVLPTKKAAVKQLKAIKVKKGKKG